MKASWNGKVIAQSDDTVVVEGNHYFPDSALDRRYVTFSNHKTTCAWKGQASYYSLLVDGELNTDAVWYYPDPKPEAEMVRGRVAFWRGVEVTD
ncbi:MULTISPECIES: DUF427 domain-containing protein [Ramlibacter]|jgi:uncharacterized protein (DUF427 family)|uniref:DUF427 domain-containing protein n=1 Tax=Ramlibacter pinisoli TaxID=2682844 RepID=A0A6N8IPS3_9BURK|nr:MULTISPECIES: DUF427 domain-containing protein [Ramlibacter]MBA2963881.1 DUF427 domain-containing protein [Ramlibacter sp. CGMCC 1.13660]MVQ28847.1 DUF427 domain-containing protein [Ramlibacter pinisoli]